ncbi:MFS transporter [Dactylosporangium darangshiense]|uniref:MFS transporter n=1 Tax=Dactylosporangium darangshiense TaxID=579108 RepID=A0ABP8DUI1_9ACTN
MIEATSGVENGGTRRGWLAVVVVGLGTFTLVTNEFLPVGLLSAIRADLRVSEGTAGTMMTMPGAVAAVSAPLLTVAAGRLDRRIVMLVMAALFTASDALGALAPNFGTMLAARFLLGLGIGGFWAIGASIGNRLVAPGSAGRATAVIFSGVSIAAVLGVPAGALVGGLFGWRVAFAVTALLGFVTLAALTVLLPALPVEEPVTLRQLSSVLRGRNGRTGLITTLGLVVGHFVAYTFISPFLEQQAGLGSRAISVLLLVFGGAGIIGNFAIGAALRARLRTAIVAVIVVLGACAALMPMVGMWGWAAAAVLAVWGLAYGAVPIALQTWVFTADDARPEGGSALYISTFQISIALGALLGGRIVDAAGIPNAMVTGAGLALLALIVFVVFTTKTATARAAAETLDTHVAAVAP